MPPPPARAQKWRLRLVRAEVSGLDRLLPASPRAFLAVSVALAGGLWLAGYALADDRARFLRSREWLVQPFYLFVHLAMLWLFVTTYSTQFAAGAGSLDMPPEEVRRRQRIPLGPAAIAVACLVAAPFVVMDVDWLRGAEYAPEALGAGGGLGPADVLLAVAWAVEWLVNAVVWVLILGYLWQTMVVLKRYDFRDPLEKALRERQYRPFLWMNAQGATLTLLFGVASAIYVWIAQGASSDYLGLWVTGGMVLVGFVPPWMRLKARVGARVEEEAQRLGTKFEQGMGALDAAPAGEPATIDALRTRLDLALAVLRLEHLRRLHAELGKSEAQALVIRLLAPAVTALRGIFRPF